MTILITGSTGKTSKRLAEILQASNTPFLIATRRDASEIPFPSVQFDWHEAKSFENPFNTATDISAVYLVAPETPEPAPFVNPFIDLAIAKGVKKYVLLSGTPQVKGGQFSGRIWSHLEQANVEFAVLRPTWFMENFSELQHQPSIKNDSTIYTAAEYGKVPFVSVDDIAEAASSFLLGKIPYGNKDYVILGPEALDHGETAEILSSVLGRQIVYVPKSVDEMVAQYTGIGLKPMFANAMPYLETLVRDGSEAKLKNDLESLIGKKGIDFRTWAEREAKGGYWG
ncbi:NAD(P)-binding protein [Aaosphaeria arxii CBS 175.79]|uniref:NAD(P)-binding protein n=1 Tax=Aaosphaeria arxii CBS 175.79 TaxID=1450172 RepID=A0A6A5Y5S6_9PLEO|nr:NAD(P)-binding protein [Aaosphaeria arxii CBS 175.79]KAF2020120.1 NAD(P)-binding protein [Aaosphaeria arxii CBS 175.79]